MNDKEAFEDWLSDASNHFADALAYEFERNLCYQAWLAGCEHKNQEVVFYKSQLEVAEKILTEVQADKWSMREQINRLREALEFYAVNGLAKVEVDQKIDERLIHEFYINGAYAREALNNGGNK